MRFEDALKLMREGKKFTTNVERGWRTAVYSWNEEKGLVFIVPGDRDELYSTSAILLSAAVKADWTLFEEPHDFAWACQQMDAGKEVCRLHPEGENASRGTVSSQESLFYRNDIEAKDWVLA